MSSGNTPHSRGNCPRRNKTVAFSSHPVVSVNAAASARSHDVHSASTRSPTPSSFERRRHSELTRRADKTSARDENASVVNTDGRVCIERRVQQRTAILAVLSYQKKLRQSSSTGAAASTSNLQLLAPVSFKLSQRAKEIALETARLVFLDVYPQHSASSHRTPICISEFPSMKQKKRVHPGDRRDDGLQSTM